MRRTWVRKTWAPKIGAIDADSSRVMAGPTLARVLSRSGMTRAAASRFYRPIFSDYVDRLLPSFATGRQARPERASSASASAGPLLPDV